MKTLVNTLLIALTLVSSAATFSTAKPIVRPVKQAAAYEVGIYTAVDGNLRLALDKQKGGRVTVCIKNTQGRKLITEYTGKGQTKARYNFNVNELPDGIYSVEISNGVQTTTHELTINTPKAETLSRQIALN